MGRTPVRAKLVLDSEVRSKLESIAKSRTEGQARIERAKVLLAYHAGERVTALAAAFQTNRAKIERILNRALEMGALASLEDRPGRGRKPEITAEARAWLMAVACTKPVDLGYPEELWATRTLAAHARKYGPEAGHPCLALLGRGTVSKLLTGAELRPHKIEYYLERRDPECDTKMAQVLMVYREVQVLQEKLQSGDQAEAAVGQLRAVLSLSLDPGAPQAYLKSRPNRFEFVFTPKHGSWLNLVEVFFAKMAKTILRGIRVASKAELKDRIMRYLQDLNADPVVFRWRYRPEGESVS